MTAVEMNKVFDLLSSTVNDWKKDLIKNLGA